MENLEWDGYGSPVVGATVAFVSDDTQSPQGWAPADLVKVLDYVEGRPICWNSAAGTAVLVRLTQLEMSPADQAKAARGAAVAEMLGYYQPLLEDAPLLFARSLYDAGFRAPAPAPGDAPDTL